MNKWIGIGRLCSDPEITTSQSGTKIARYRLAVNRRRKVEGQPDADFINCVAFGKSAEFAERYLHKGLKVAVEGRIQTGSYEKDGQKHYTTDIVVESQEFCESKTDFAGDNQCQQQAPIEQGYEEVTGDDLPF